jgi:hypothetical protein
MISDAALLNAGFTAGVLVILWWFFKDGDNDNIFYDGEDEY